MKRIRCSNANPPTAKRALQPFPKRNEPLPGFEYLRFFPFISPLSLQPSWRLPVPAKCSGPAWAPPLSSLSFCGCIYGSMGDCGKGIKKHRMKREKAWEAYHALTDCLYCRRRHDGKPEDFNPNFKGGTAGQIHCPLMPPLN